MSCIFEHLICVHVYDGVFLGELFMYFGCINTGEGVVDMCSLHLCVLVFCICV